MQSELINLGLLVFFSIIGALLSFRFKQPVLLGLIVIGAAVGPNALGLIHNEQLIELSIEFGAIVSLFVLGMEFSLRKLQKIGSKSLIIALFKVGIMFFITFLTVVLLKQNLVTAAFTGVALSFSSTMIIIAYVKQKNMLRNKEVPIIIAILILEDIFGVFALTIFSAKQDVSTSILNNLQSIMISLLVLVLAYFIASKFAEWMLTWVQQHTHDEIMILLVLGMCIAFSYLAYVLHLSPSAGAFLAGSVVSNFRESKKLEKSVQPHNYIFSTFFFIAMGTMVDFKAIFVNWHILVVLAVITVVGLFIAMGLMTRIFTNATTRASVFSSIIMLPPGIFSLLVAKASLNFQTGFDVLAVVSALILIHTVTLNVMMSKIDWITGLFEKRSQKSVGAISRFFSNFFSEMEIETKYTKTLRTRIYSFVLKVLILLAFGLFLNRILSIRPTFLMVLALIGYAAAFILLGIRAVREMNSVFVLITKIISDLEAGTRKANIYVGIKYLSLAILTMLVGLFSPFIVFMVELPVYSLILSALIVIGGVIIFIRAATRFIPLTFKYKYSIPEYKKFEFKKSAMGATALTIK